MMLVSVWRKLRQPFIFIAFAFGCAPSFSDDALDIQDPGANAPEIPDSSQLHDCFQTECLPRSTDVPFSFPRLEAGAARQPKDPGNCIPYCSHGGHYLFGR